MERKRERKGEREETMMVCERGGEWRDETGSIKESVRAEMKGRVRKEEMM